MRTLSITLYSLREKSSKFSMIIQNDLKMSQEVTITSYQPDLVLIYRKEVHLLELTVCGNSEQVMAAVHQRQSTKQEYIHLISDVTRAGWKANYTTLEIGVLGHYLPPTPTELSAAHPNIHHTYWLKILQSTTKIAISCLFPIFLTHDELKWSPRPLHKYLKGIIKFFHKG